MNEDMHFHHPVGVKPIDDDDPCHAVQRFGTWGYISPICGHFTGNKATGAGITFHHGGNPEHALFVPFEDYATQPFPIARVADWHDAVCERISVSSS